ncbi:MAG: AzlD domain-containing protein [Oscillospiraceae bacterium]|nr:AzlD domain-containing protein [Oscillospiraceae bacterium]
MNRSVYLYILVGAAVSFIIRVLPLTLIRKQISNRFLRSFLYYVPYVTLAVMTFPAILYAAQYPLAGVAALAVGAVLAWFGVGLFPVAIACCASVFLVEFIITLV